MLIMNSLFIIHVTATSHVMGVVLNVILFEFKSADHTIFIQSSDRQVEHPPQLCEIYFCIMVVIQCNKYVIIGMHNYNPTIHKCNKIKTKLTFSFFNRSLAIISNTCT